VKHAPLRRFGFRLRRRRDGERGFVAIEFVAGCAFLLLPVAVLVSVMPTWSERQSMARSAAREAGRTYVLTADPQQAQSVVDQIAENHHLKDGELHLQLTGDPRVPGGEVRATVKVDVPATVIPVLDANTDAFSFTESHSEVVDLYREVPK
jgi:Flp pilus assembly protein TadG